MTPMFRYFLGFQVAADRAGWLARQLPRVSGDLFAGLKPQRYHLTLCTIAETPAPHPFLRQRVARAFEAGLPFFAWVREAVGTYDRREMELERARREEERLLAGEKPRARVKSREQYRSMQ